MKEYLLLAAFMAPTLVVAAAAVVSFAHPDDSAARDALAFDLSCSEGFSEPTE